MTSLVEPVLSRLEFEPIIDDQPSLIDSGSGVILVDIYNYGLHIFHQSIPYQSYNKESALSTAQQHVNFQKSLL